MAVARSASTPTHSSAVVDGQRGRHPADGHGRQRPYCDGGRSATRCRNTGWPTIPIHRHRSPRTGPLPTGIVAVTVRLAGSILETVESRLFATHRRPAANASEPGPVPTCTRRDDPPRCRSDLQDRRAGVVGDPQRACSEHDRRRRHIERESSVAELRSPDRARTAPGSRNPRPIAALRRTPTRRGWRLPKRDRLRDGLSGRVDPHDRGAERIGDPDRSVATGDARRIAANRDPADPTTAYRVDLRNDPVAGIRSPHRARARSDRRRWPGERRHGCDPPRSCAPRPRSR